MNFSPAATLHLYNMADRCEKLQQLHCYHPFSDSRDTYLTKNHHENYSSKMVPTNLSGSWTKTNCRLKLTSEWWAKLQEANGQSAISNTATTLSYKAWNSAVEYPCWEYKFDIKESYGQYSNGTQAFVHAAIYRYHLNETSKLHITVYVWEESTDESSQRDSNAEIVSISWLLLGPYGQETGSIAEIRNRAVIVTCVANRLMRLRQMTQMLRVLWLNIQYIIYHVVISYTIS